MNKTEKVTEFIQNLDNPFKDEIELVRKIILNSNSKITEDIKWSAPSFSYKGNIATFNIRSKNFVNLTFHKGSLIDDGSGFLEGDSKEARVARFRDENEIIEKREALESAINRWIDLMDK